MKTLVVDFTMLGSIISVLMFLGVILKIILALSAELKNIKHNVRLIFNIVKDIESFLAKKGDYNIRSQSELFED